MPQIPLYTSQVGRPVMRPALRPLDLPSGGQALAEGLSRLGAGTVDTAQKFQQEEDNRTVLNLRLKAMKDFDTFRQGFQNRSDYQNFEPEAAAYAAQWQKENLGDNVNQQVADAMALPIGELSMTTLADVRRDARDTHMGVSLGQLDTGLAGIDQQYTTATDPKQREMLVGLAKEMIQQRVEDGVMRPDEAAQLWRKKQQGFGDTDVARAMLANPAQLLQDLKDPTKYPWVTGPDRFNIQAQIQNKLDIEARQRQADMRSSVAAQLADEQAARADGATTGLTNASIVAAYGPADGAKIIADMQRGYDLNQNIKTAANMTPAEEAATLASMKPEGEGYAAEARNYDLFQKALDMKHAALDKEPAGYVVANNTTVRSLFDTAAQSGEPADFQKAIVASLQAQADQGVPTWKREPLPAKVATDFVTSWQTLSDPKQRFEKLAGYVNSVSDPGIQKQLFGQLVDAGLPAAASYPLEILRGDSSKLNVATRVMEEVTQKNAADLGTDAKRDMVTATQKEYSQGIGSAIANQLTLTGNNAYLARLQGDLDVLQKSVASRMAAAGDSADADAIAAQSYQDIFGTLTTAGDASLGTVIAPVSANRDKLETGMDVTRRKVANIIRATVNPLGPNPSPVEQKQIDSWRLNLEDQLRWVNRDSENYQLVDTSTGMVVTLNGKPYTATLDELTQAATAQREPMTGPDGAVIGPPAMPDRPASQSILSDQVDPEGTLPTKQNYPSLQNMATLKLTPQEQNLYQHHLDNLANHKAVKNDDGSVSTIRQISVERDGRYYNIPTVWDGKILSGDDAMKRAAAVGWNHWPSYPTEAEAESRYTAMHDIMAPDVGGYQ